MNGCSIRWSLRTSGVRPSTPCDLTQMNTFTGGLVELCVLDPKGSAVEFFLMFLKLQEQYSFELLLAMASNSQKSGKERPSLPCDSHGCVSHGAFRARNRLFLSQSGSHQPEKALEVGALLHTQLGSGAGNGPSQEQKWDELRRSERPQTKESKGKSKRTQRRNKSY